MWAIVSRRTKKLMSPVTDNIFSTLLFQCPQLIIFKNRQKRRRRTVRRDLNRVGEEANDRD